MRLLPLQFPARTLTGRRNASTPTVVPATLLVLLLLLPLAATPVRAVPIEPIHAFGHRLTLRVADARTRQPLAARVSVVGSGGESLHPIPRESALYHEAYFGHRYFYADGSATLLVPPGRTSLRVFHGFEYVAAVEELEVDRDLEYTVYLPRLTDMGSLGWRGGDTHIHMNHGGFGDVYELTAEDLFLVQRAEDLAVANVLDNAPDFTGALHPLSTTDHRLFFGIEYRSAFWGHLGVLGTGAATPFQCCSKGQPAFPMNVDLVGEARRLGGTVVFAHPVTVPRGEIGITDAGWPWTGHGRELPIDVALGEIDAIDVMSYSNRQRVEYQTWYDLLNHGFHIPASAGTDASVNRWYDPPAGGYRVYARAPGPDWTYEAWLEALRRGESFITNGPLFRYFLLDAASLGRTLTLTPERASGTLTGRLEVISQWPLSEVRIVMNGQVVDTIVPSGTDRRIVRGTFKVNPRGESAWVAAHAIGQHPNPFSIGSGIEAHTNPIYLHVPGKPLRFGGLDPGYYVRWVDDVWSLAQARGFAGPEDATEVAARIERARRVLRNRTTLVPGRGPDDPPDVHGQPGVDASGAGMEEGRVHLEARPNPGRGEIRFSWTAGTDAPERFELYDVQGRLLDVRRLPESAAASGAWSWSSGGAGERPAGIYFALLRGADSVRRVRLVLTP